MPVLQGSDTPFNEFRAALLGMRREQIAQVLGVPPTASLGLGATLQRKQQPISYMDASTWYYPFDVSRAQAMAIQFVGNRARAVEFIIAA